MKKKVPFLIQSSGSILTANIALLFPPAMSCLCSHPFPQFPSLLISVREPDPLLKHLSIFPTKALL